MDPREIERDREAANVNRAILEEVRLIKEYVLEVIKTQRIIREELRNINNLRPLREKSEEEKEVTANANH